MFGLFKTPNVINMTPSDVKAGLDAGTLILVDVREPDEFRAERIEGARNIPLSRFNPDALPNAEGKTVVLHCAGGVRSGRAIEMCRKSNVAINSHLAGGLSAWKANGFPTRN